MTVPTGGIQHGSTGDPRYPSPRTLRVVLAFAVDFLLHAGVLVGSFVYFQHTTELANFPTLPALAVYVIVSFGHRTVLQWIFQATFGKALFGLRVIRCTDGGRVRYRDLVVTWFVGVAIAVVAVADLAGGGSAGGPSLENDRFPSVVRRRDLVQLRTRGLSFRPA